MEISSVPSSPNTSQAFSEPTLFKVSAIGLIKLFLKAPVSWRFTLAGLVKGPKILKIVRVPNSVLTGITCAMAGWYKGAIINAIPISSKALLTISFSVKTFIPISLKRSADPDFELKFLFPCFATGTPAPATTNAAAVEMFKVPLPSPPVPTISIASEGAITGVAFALIASVAAKYSSKLSPLALSAIKNPAVCALEDSPLNSESNASLASV